MKVLNLYAGIGGNRKMWRNCKVTAVEIDSKIANIYKRNFPQDTIIIDDAHQYLENNFRNFDFIWSSPPCPSHSKINKCYTYGNATNPPIFPDMKLYEEILFLQGYFDGMYCVENVISWYKPLITPQQIAMHYFWANFYIAEFNIESREHYGGLEKLSKLKGFDVKRCVGIDKIKVLRNCVEPELGAHIIECMIRQKEIKDKTKYSNQQTNVAIQGSIFE